MGFFFLIDSPDSSGKWLAICVGTLFMIYVVMRPLMKKKDPLAQQTPMRTSLAQQRAVERQMQNVLVDMSEMARQITAQLDTRAAKLELLIKDADAKIAAMGAAPPAVKGRMLKVPAVETANEMQLPENPPDPRHADIYTLADQGRSPAEIARQLNRPSGEIELILALRQ